MHAQLTEVRRAIERLKGMMVGIAVDQVVTDEEVHQLNEWLEMHSHFHTVKPFNTVVLTLKRILADNHIDSDEREELLSICHSFDSPMMAPRVATEAIRRLHGILQGIAADKMITQGEVVGLKEWLAVHNLFHEFWPFNEVWELTNRILSDGIVHDHEKAELLEYCQSFTEQAIDDPVFHDAIYNENFMQTVSPALLPFTALCDRKCCIEFAGRTFCFTGPARTGTRKELQWMVRKLDGIPKNNAVAQLDYLVVGAQSSPCWAYSTYGRKIEAVIENREKRGAETVILHEDDFIEQATPKLHT